MARFTVIAFVSAVMAVLLGCAASQTVHVVGDSVGWTVPQGGATVYSNWANGKTFAVGDILTFNFQTNEHDVLQVQKTSFDACTSTDAIGDAVTTGPTNITLASAGVHYYICTIGRHCQFGQKLDITVSSGAPGATPPTTSPTTPPPTTPSPTSPSPTSGEVPCAPTPSPSSTKEPTGSTPTGPTTSTTPPTPGSSASNVLASASVSMLALTMGLLF
ncbi:hypothetical protein K2173_017202 [Erythroxylum novogranatense]|uniref:Phytocyanin domain-containing protein n=1 Tax=Erythroxylum novogranatense TaxID=1862640 RepID=A0AAV8U643_9ROSI|nr:hypothetical protein K2173_017202 [Erythroxylum novogranatense]